MNGRFNIRLIAFDLDGTLLTTDKRLSEGNRRALERAHEQGILLVPSTGRFFDGMPTVIKELPFIRYAILVNGAVVYDRQQDKELAKTLIPWQEAIRVYEYLDDFDVIYDCYVGNGGFMTRAMQEKAAAYAPSDYYLERIFRWRKPVEELKAYLSENEIDVSKIQLFARDMELRERLLQELPARFPKEAVASSLSNNIELNDRQATKGNALRLLADNLGIPMEETMAIGDDLNDMSMLEAAGYSVAMGNAKEIIKAAADTVTADNDHDGVAAAIAEICYDERV